MNMQSQLQAALDAATAQAPMDVIQNGNVGIGTTNDDVAVSLAAPANDDTSPPQRSYPQVTNDDDVTFTNISDRALLFTLKRSMFSTNVKDIGKTNEYGAGHVTKKLFKGNNLVADARSAYDKVYTYVMENTLPWDVGVRLANMLTFQEFSAKLRELIADADAADAKLDANWPDVRSADHQRLTQLGICHNNPDLALWSDYPDDISACYSITTDIDPIAKADGLDPRYGVTDEQIEGYKQRLVDANKNSGTNVIANLLKPMHEAIIKLTDYDEDERMNKTIVTNMTGVADRMSRANVCDDPRVAQHIADLSTLAGGLCKDILKHSKVARDVAIAELKALETKMEGFV